MSNKGTLFSYFSKAGSTSTSASSPTPAAEPEEPKPTPKPAEKINRPTESTSSTESTVSTPKPATATRALKQKKSTVIDDDDDEEEDHAAVTIDSTEVAGIDAVKPMLPADRGLDAPIPEGSESKGVGSTSTSRRKRVVFADEAEKTKETAKVSITDKETDETDEKMVTKITPTQRSKRKNSECIVDDENDKEGASGTKSNSIKKPATAGLFAHFSRVEDSDSDDDNEGRDEDTKKKPKRAVPPAGELLPRTETEEALLFDLWEPGEPVPYLALAKTFEEIARISSRLKITEHLMRLFVEVIRRTPDDLITAVYLSVNQLAPAYHGIELGIGESLIQKAICAATGRTMPSLKGEYDVVGDLGLIAQMSKSNQQLMFKPPRLTLKTVFRKFNEIAKMSGNSSMQTKLGIINHLMVAAQDCEPQFLVRSLQGKLRIGLAEKTVLVALAHASVVARADNPRAALRNAEALEDASKTLRAVYSELPNYDRIIPALLEAGVAGLPERCHLTTGIPVAPMLAHPTHGIGEVFERLGSRAFTCEFKYDGERAQVHRLADGKLFIYSRNAENNTPKYPDIVGILNKAMKPHVQSFIIDSEAVAIDLDSGKLLPFQRLSTRARKDVSIENIKVNVCLFAFDILFLNGQSLLQQPLRARREILYNSFDLIPQQFAFARSSDGLEDSVIQAFLDESIDGQCEGLMVKTLDEAATYEPARRSYNWLKIKKDYLDGVADTIDLVPIGAVHGRGKRTGMYGGYLVACYDEDTEQYQAVTLLGTGFTDEELKQYTVEFEKYVVPAKPHDYFADKAPDVWFSPKQVWEVKCADFSLSTAYKGAFGMVESNKGISLRFPRLVRVRDDKGPTQATTAEQLAELYRRQALVQGSSSSSSSASSSSTIAATSSTKASALDRYGSDDDEWL